MDLCKDLEILCKIPLEIVEHIISFKIDKRGYCDYRNYEFKKNNKIKQKRVLNELKILYTTYFWDKYINDVTNSNAYIRLTYLDKKLGFYNKDNINDVLKLEIKSKFSDKISQYRGNYWTIRKAELTNMSDEERKIHMELSVLKYIDNLVVE